TEIRESFLKFFEGKKHLRWPSASIVPLDDPTLLLMTAGMAPFKSYFSGLGTPPAKRMTTCQKCVRADDIDRVGRTIRHHTFFEMLGNFSFGDYYKQDTILWAWEYMTKVMNLPEDKLFVTIHTDDDGAFDIWTKEVGVPADKITRVGDNFWGPVGEAGPCGPCSEVCYDLGESFGCGKPDCKPGCDCDRYLEVWNLVFTGLNKSKEGKFSDLPAQCIDTGLGLERLAMVMQNKPSPFHTDLFDDIIKHIEKISGKKLSQGKETDLAVKIIADHIRASVFMIADGITPSNQGRGYVLRRFLRRSITFGRTHLGIKENFLYKLVDSVTQIYKPVYKELADKKILVRNLILLEEETFGRTLNKGLEIIRKEIQDLKEEGKNIISGDIVFRLYDTYGFPPELTSEVAKEHDFNVDMKEFEEYLNGQRERARRDLDDKLKVHTSSASELKEVFEQEFIGDKEIKAKSILKGFHNYPDNEVDLYINPTPFYAESGGQIYDTGTISSDDFKVEIERVAKHESGVSVHSGRLVEGAITKKDIEVESCVDSKRRLKVMCNHTATHLLHSALRHIIGKHAAQTGSFVGEDSLRFDYTHGKPLTEEQVRQIEDLVNEKIIENIKVGKELLDIEDALNSGAIALFQEKYDKKVNVVKVGGFSAELCGGTHVDYTGQIGLFKILKESSVGTGVRRIEAVTGITAIDLLHDIYRDFEIIKTKLNLKEEEVADKVLQLYEDNISKQKEIDILKAKQVLESTDDYLKDAEDINGVKLVRKVVKQVSIDNLRSMSDKLKLQLKSGIIILGTEQQGKATILVSVTKDLVDKGYNAGKIVGALAEVVGGRGGGRPDFAQAGGKDTDKLTEALDKAGELIGKG
ncbi:MAG: alanine--tRNA ligase, partial [Armatimonadota bacterium]